MTNTHALFAWEAHEQRGGVHDLQMTGDLLTCVAASDDLSSTLDEFSVVEIATLREVLCGSVEVKQHPLTGHPAGRVLRWSAAPTD